MFSHPVRIGAPAVGFILGLVVTYGFADAGPGPVSSRILRDALLQSSVGSDIRIGNESLASFDERFALGKIKKESSSELSALCEPRNGPRRRDTYRASLRFYAFVRHAPTRASRFIRRAFCRHKGRESRACCPVARIFMGRSTDRRRHGGNRHIAFPPNAEQAQGDIGNLRANGIKHDA